MNPETKSENFSAPSKHLFVCTNCVFRNQDGSCSEKDEAVQFRKRLKQMAAEHFTKEQLRVNASGCLGKCSRGISSVLYPEGLWNLELRPGDEMELLEWLKKQ